MRLLFISSEFPPGPGGIGNHAYHLVSQLQKHGWDIAVVAAQDYVSSEEVSEFNQLQPFSIVSLRHVLGAPFEAVYRAYAISIRIARWWPDVILASGARFVWLMSWLAKWYRIPWVAVGHGTEFGTTVGWEQWLTCRSFGRASGVVCVSQYTQQRMLAMEIQPKRNMVIPNGADATKFAVLPSQVIEPFRSAAGLTGMRVILTVGNVTGRKGQDIVIRALPSILQKLPNVMYLIAGLPTKKTEFAQLAANLGVADHVHFLGKVSPDDLIRYLNLCDVFVMTSRHANGNFEGYGIAVVEAAFCGKPAVVSANSGLYEAIVDGQTGIGVPENDPDSTARALLTLLEDDEQRNQMGEAARQRALREQNWAHRVETYDAFLRKLVDEEKTNRITHPPLLAKWSTGWMGTNCPGN
jgi:phosphatidylinositol alpha-1,6-mannosyltransferase